MNKVYKRIWSKVKGKWITISRGDSPIPIVCVVILALFLTFPGKAFTLDPNTLPTGGKITSGSINPEDDRQLEHF
jgi:hypothetical protein